METVLYTYRAVNGKEILHSRTRDMAYDALEASIRDEFKISATPIVQVFSRMIGYILRQEDAEGRQAGDEGRKYRLMREDWGNVKRIATHSWTQHRHGGIAYIYTDLYAVLDNGTKLSMNQVGPYKFNDRKWERDEKEALDARLGRKEETAIYVAQFTNFFRLYRELEDFSKGWILTPTPDQPVAA
jgi:hypothetical protein